MQSLEGYVERERGGGGGVVRRGQGVGLYCIIIPVIAHIVTTAIVCSTMDSIALVHIKNTIILVQDTGSIYLANCVNLYRLYRLNMHALRTYEHYEI